MNTIFNRFVDWYNGVEKKNLNAAEAKRGENPLGGPAAIWDNFKLSKEQEEGLEQLKRQLTPPKRKVVQIAPVIATAAHCTELYALCDDGSVWSHDVQVLNSSWSRLPDIPQDEVK